MMIRNLIIPLIVLTASTVAAVDMRYYFDRETDSAITDASRILIYNPDALIKDRNVTGATIYKPFRDYTSAKLKNTEARLGAFGNISSAGAWGGRVKFSADGTVRLQGTATAFDDMQISLLNIKAPAANPPAYLLYQGSEVPAFSATATNVLYFNVQLPHRWKEGSNIACHLHAAYPDATAGNSYWTFTYSWANYLGTFPTATTLNGTFAAPALANKHDIHSFTPLSGAGKTISSVILGSLSRVGANAADTYAGSIYGTSFDCHFEVDSFGSDTEFGKTP